MMKPVSRESLPMNRLMRMAATQKTVPSRAIVRMGLMFLTAALWFGASALSSGGENEIPEVDKNYQAVVVDSTSTTTNGENVSVEGLLYFSVRRGEMTVFVPFDKLQSAEVLGNPVDVGGIDRVEVSFTFKDGGVEKGFVKARDLVYGSSRLGNFKLKIKDVRSIRFQAS